MEKIRIAIADDDAGMRMVVRKLIERADDYALVGEAENGEELLSTLTTWREGIAPYVGNTHAFLREAERSGKTILLEGQLGSMKDPDLGICPFTTSSHTLAGYGTVGGAVPPTAITDVVCVTKAYSSAVGAGAFVSELFGGEAKGLYMLDSELAARVYTAPSLVL